MSDLFGYRGKRVVVSGCYSGMGEATARLLLELGAEVHGIDYKPSTLGLASFNLADLRDPATIDSAVSAIGGKVDALFNCAGLGPTFPALDQITVNFVGTRHVTERVLPLMRDGGAIASISSTAGIGWSQRMPAVMTLLGTRDNQEAVAWCKANPETVADGYSLSKEAIVVWTMRRSYDLIKRGIRINCILPGPTQTPMMTDQIEVSTPAAVLDAVAEPIGRRARPEEQANALVFLNSAMASYVNGVWLPDDGGFIAGVATGQIDMTAMMGKAAEPATA